MATRAIRWPSTGGFSLPPGALRRGLLAGSAWGVATGGIMTAVSAWNCGGICLPDAALTTAIAIAAGICTIGPLAAFGARPTERSAPRPEGIAHRGPAIG